MSDELQTRIGAQAQSRLHSVRKFYFLDYFYVLLKSVERYSTRAQVFDAFKTMKHEYRLGESKYKRLTAEEENLSPAKLNRYRYTFRQVIEEAKEYALVEEYDSDSLRLTDHGTALIDQFEIGGPTRFNRELFRLMEEKYGAFRYLIDLLYASNRRRPGLLVLPIYSPAQLHFERPAVRTTNDIVQYAEKLALKLQDDLQQYLGESLHLSEHNDTLLQRLYEDELLPKGPKDAFKPEHYNVITKRFRDYWITYLLREVYGYQYSASSFDIWTYRGKQVGILHATEFYPGFNGRIVYPTSVLTTSTESRDFEDLYRYDDNVSLFIHYPRPLDGNNNERFIGALVDSYFDLRRTNRNYFVNLSALGELVCYGMKISRDLFAEFLNNAYRLNLRGQLRIRISLEVDRLPEETSAMYLKREPVMVDGKYRNIIGIDITKGIP